MFFLVNLYLLKFSTDVLLIAPGVMGLLFGASRIWDAVSDPLVGFLSDRTRSRLGRRRPWVLASIVPTVVVFLMIWSPPATLSDTALVTWMAVGIFGFYTAVTIFGVPHAALGAELSTDYDERNRIFGGRQIAYNIGAFLAVGGMTWLIRSDEPRTTAFEIAILASLIAVPTLVWCVVGSSERIEHQGRGGGSPWTATRDIWRNPHARLLLVVIFIEHLGSATIAILTPYVSQYAIHTPEKTGLYIFLYMLASTISVPVWIRLAASHGKKRLWLFSMVLAGASFGAMFLGGPGDWILIATLSFLGGTASGCGMVVGQSIKADVIDYDEWKTGERKEGAYFAAWSFVFKGAGGITMMITGLVLEYSGFVPNAPQTETATLAMRVLFAIFPLVCYAIGAILFTRFSLNREEHAQIRAAIDARHAAGEA
ncbi:putative symporter YjmB [Myxococcaceae bacterium]|nr:putative symporter YjmB [Myxococcaceae bacterium]